VCKRTKSDRKGGHLAVRKSDGRIVLRDTAMVAEGEERYFRDIKRHSTFNANNVWINLEVLRERMTAKQGVLGLPIIVNHKNVDPADPGSPEVIQMESAMGTAIEVFEGSEAILVPRTRFRPVKTTNDLLVIRSDFFALDEGYHVVATVDAPEPYVDLDSAYRFVSGFEQRFPKGVPSMRDCTSLRVIGDPVFGRNVRCVGEVLIDGYRRVLDDAVLGELLLQVGGGERVVRGLADLDLAGGRFAQALQVADVPGLRVEAGPGTGFLVQDPGDEVAVGAGVVHQAVDVVGDIGVVDQPPQRPGAEGLLDVDDDEGSLGHASMIGGRPGCAAGSIRPRCGTIRSPRPGPRESWSSSAAQRWFIVKTLSSPGLRPITSRFVPIPR